MNNYARLTLTRPTGTTFSLIKLDKVVSGEGLSYLNLSPFKCTLLHVNVLLRRMVC